MEVLKTLEFLKISVYVNSIQPLEEVRAKADFIDFDILLHAGYLNLSSY
jgi:hypothetical protein